MAKFVQRDLGTTAEASSGGGRRGWWREIFTVVGAIAVLVTVAYLLVGWTIEWALPRIPIEKERAWFGGFRAWKLDAPLSPEEQQSVAEAETVLRKLVAQPGVPGLDYRLVLLRDSQPNAVAFPGGTIGITSGLLELVDGDEVALAFVLGHELGHFAQRDHLRMIGRRTGRAVVWAVLFGDGGGELLTEQLPALLDLHHSRESEVGADRLGVRLVQQAFGTTRGTDRLFTWLAAQERLPGWTAMLTTHPAAADRLQALRRYADELSQLSEAKRPAELESAPTAP